MDSQTKIARFKRRFTQCSPPPYSKYTRPHQKFGWCSYVNLFRTCVTCVWYNKGMNCRLAFLLDVILRTSFTWTHLNSHEFDGYLFGRGNDLWLVNSHCKVLSFLNFTCNGHLMLVKLIFVLCWFTQSGWFILHFQMTFVTICRIFRKLPSFSLKVDWCPTWAMLCIEASRKYVRSLRGILLGSSAFCSISCTNLHSGRPSTFHYFYRGRLWHCTRVSWN